MVQSHGATQPDVDASPESPRSPDHQQIFLSYTRDYPNPVGYI